MSLEADIAAVTKAGLGIAGGFFPVVTPEIGAFVAALAAKAVELLKPQQVIVNADSVVVEFGRTEGGGAP